MGTVGWTSENCTFLVHAVQLRALDAHGGCWMREHTFFNRIDELEPIIRLFLFLSHSSLYHSRPIALHLLDCVAMG